MGFGALADGDADGLQRVVDLGDITGARATELYLALWLRLMRSLGTPRFNISLEQA